MLAFLGGVIFPLKNPLTKPEISSSPAQQQATWRGIWGCAFRSMCWCCWLNCWQRLQAPALCGGFPDGQLHSGRHRGYHPKHRARRKALGAGLQEHKHTAVRAVLPDSPGAHMAHCWDCCKWLCPTAASTGPGQKRHSGTHLKQSVQTVPLGPTACISAPTPF